MLGEGKHNLEKAEHETEGELLTSLPVEGIYVIIQNTLLTHTLETYNTKCNATRNT